MGKDVVSELRDTLERHDEWPTRETSALVVDTARRLIRAIDQRAELIEYERLHVTPTEQAISEILAPPGGAGGSGGGVPTVGGVSYGPGGGVSGGGIWPAAGGPPPPGGAGAGGRGGTWTARPLWDA